MYIYFCVFFVCADLNLEKKWQLVLLELLETKAAFLFRKHKLVFG